MIGFAGYAFMDPAEPHRLLQRFAERFVHIDGPYLPKTFAEPGFGIVVLARSAEDLGFARCNDTRLIVVAGGQFDDTGSLAAIAEDNPTRAAERILAAYEFEGRKALPSLSGRFAILLWDPEMRRLLLSTDPLGLRRVCWAEAGGGLYFGTELKPLLAHESLSRGLDDDAVAQFLAIGYPLQDRTMMRAVRRLPAGGLLTATPDSRKVLTAPWTPPPIDASLSLRDAADALGETLGMVLRDFGGRIVPPVVLPLSGGLDSRTLLGFAIRAGIEGISTYTFGHAHCYDRRFAKRLASKAGVPNTAIDLPQDYAVAWGPQETEITDGEISARYAYYGSLKLGQAPAGSALLSGFLIDQLSGHALRDYESLPDDATRLDTWYRHRFNGSWGGRRCWDANDLIPTIVQPRFRELFAHAPRQSLADIVNQTFGETFSRRALTAEILHRQSRFTGFQLDSLGRYYKVFAPFADHRVLDSFSTMPSRHLQAQAAYKLMITRFLSGFARVPNTKSGRRVSYQETAAVPISPRAHLRIPAALPPRLAWRLAAFRKRCNGGLAQLSGGWFGEHNRKEYTHPDTNMRLHSHAFRKFFADADAFVPYFEPKAVLALFEDHVAARTNADPVLYNLMTFALWRRYMCDSGATP